MVRWGSFHGAYWKIEKSFGPRPGASLYWSVECPLFPSKNAKLHSGSEALVFCHLRTGYKDEAAVATDGLSAIGPTAGSRALPLEAGILEG